MFVLPKKPEVPEDAAVLPEPNPKLAVGFGASGGMVVDADGTADFEVTPKLNLTGAVLPDVAVDAGAFVEAGGVGLLNANVVEGCNAGVVEDDATAPPLEDAAVPANPPMRANSEGPEDIAP